jgi:hypothetical protein
MPNADRINGRLSSFGNIKEDGSFQDRLGIANAGVNLAINNPVGYGIGSSGLGGRLNKWSAHRIRENANRFKKEMFLRETEAFIRRVRETETGRTNGRDLTPVRAH